MVEITSEIHKKLAVSLFNKVWELIDLKDRSEEETELMINTAHASLYHWRQVGEPVNFARGEWQVSRVYSLAGRADPALHHAANSLEICQKHGIGDFDLAFAYEALARAYAIEGNNSKVEEFHKLALAAAENIKEKDDKKYFLSELESIKR
jgi:hypothetical protein